MFGGFGFDGIGAALTPAHAALANAFIAGPNGSAVSGAIGCDGGGAGGGVGYTAGSALAVATGGQGGAGE